MLVFFPMALSQTALTLHHLCCDIFSPREGELAECQSRAEGAASRQAARQEGLKCLSEAETELAKAEGMAAGRRMRPMLSFFLAI